MSEFERSDEFEEIKFIPEKLGFIVDEGLQQIKSKALQILRNYPDIHPIAGQVTQIMSEYEVAAENIIRKISDKRVTHEGISLEIRDRHLREALIGNQVDRINLLLEAGFNNAFILNELEEAIDNSDNECLFNLSNLLLAMRKRIKNII